MSGNMTSANQREVEVADEERVEASDLDESYTFQEGVFIPIFTAKATRSTGYQVGYGVKNRSLADGFADLDLVDSGTNDVTGVMRWAIYESEDLDNLLYKVNLGRTTNFSATDDDRTEKPVVHQRSPGASQDRVIALEVKVDNSTNDGNSPSQSNSTTKLGMPYASI